MNRAIHSGIKGDQVITYLCPIRHGRAIGGAATRQQSKHMLGPRHSAATGARKAEGEVSGLTFTMTHDEGEAQAATRKALVWCSVARRPEVKWLDVGSATQLRGKRPKRERRGRVGTREGRLYTAAWPRLWREGHGGCRVPQRGLGVLLGEIKLTTRPHRSVSESKTTRWCVGH